MKLNMGKNLYFRWEKVEIKINGIKLNFDRINLSVSLNIFLNVDHF